MHKKRTDYSMIKRDDLPQVLEPGDRKIIKSRIVIDRTVFQKSPEEKQRLKDAKHGITRVEKKHLSPSKQKRGDAYFAKKRLEEQKSAENTAQEPE